MVSFQQYRNSFDPQMLLKPRTNERVRCGEQTCACVWRKAHLAADSEHIGGYPETLSTKPQLLSAVQGKFTYIAHFITKSIQNAYIEMIKMPFLRKNP